MPAAKVVDPFGSPDSQTITGVGCLCEVMLLEQKYDKHGQLTTKQTGGSKIEADFSQHALVQLQIYNEKHKLVVSKLEINSPYILQALDTVVQFYPDNPTPFDEPTTIESPYMVLCHHWEELSSYATTQGDEARMHLNLLLGLMEREMGADKRKYERLLAVGHTTFPFLWTICKPGNLLSAEKCGQYRLYRLLRFTYGEDPSLGRCCDLVF